MKKDYSFEKGPSLCARFYISSALIQKIKLSLSDRFEIQILGDSAKLESQILAWAQAYLEKKQVMPPLDLDYSSLSPFQKKVLLSLSEVPFGLPLSYKMLAQRANHQNASRAVGTVCKNNPFPLVIPCHRVIRSNHQIGQFNGGVELKKRLLSFEGAFDYSA